VRVYYRDDRVQVTSTAIYVDNACYPFDRLGDMWVARRSLAARRILIGLGIVAAAVLVRVAASFVWFLGGVDRTVERWMSGGPTGVAVVAVVGLGIAVVGVLIVEAALSAIEDIRGYGRNLELWASVDGQPVRIYHTNNAQRFGQIRRAIVRALG
jgi:Family of unknown function (DUF6232)